MYNTHKWEVIAVDNRLSTKGSKFQRHPADIWGPFMSDLCSCNSNGACVPPVGHPWESV